MWEASLPELKNPEIDPWKYSQLIFDKGKDNSMEER